MTSMQRMHLFWPCRDGILIWKEYRITLAAPSCQAIYSFFFRAFEKEIHKCPNLLEVAFWGSYNYTLATLFYSGVTDAEGLIGLIGVYRYGVRRSDEIISQNWNWFMQDYLGHDDEAGLLCRLTLTFLYVFAQSTNDFLPSRLAPNFHISDSGEIPNSTVTICLE